MLLVWMLLVQMDWQTREPKQGVMPKHSPNEKPSNHKALSIEPGKPANTKAQNLIIFRSLNFPQALTL